MKFYKAIFFLITMSLLISNCKDVEDSQNAYTENPQMNTTDSGELVDPNATSEKTTLLPITNEEVMALLKNRNDQHNAHNINAEKLSYSEFVDYYSEVLTRSKITKLKRQFFQANPNYQQNIDLSTVKISGQDFSKMVNFDRVISINGNEKIVPTHLEIASAYGKKVIVT